MKKMEKDLVLETMKKTGFFKCRKDSWIIRIIDKAVDKAMADLKKEGLIVSPIRCKWEPANK